MAKDPATDADLVKNTLRGEREAFSVLVDRYRRRIFALTLQRVQDATDAEDVAQEAFIKAYRSLHTLRDHEKFGSWLYGITMHGTLDWLRLRGNRKEVASDRLGLFSLPFQDNAELRELVETVMEAVGELSDAHRLVVTLRYIEGMTSKEMAVHLGESRVAVRSRLFKAMQQLRKRLANLISTE
jgi:RNA polymerase sigma-70 factor (ECF subfamily)